MCFPCYTTGSSPDRNRTYITPKVGLRCHSLSTTPRPFCYQRCQSTYLPFTSPHYNRARQQDPRVGVVPESVKLLIGVHYSIIPLLLEPALSLLGADTLFPSCTNQPARHLLYPYKPLSLLLGMRDIRSYPQARYFIPRLFSLPLLCDLSIAAVQFSFSRVAIVAKDAPH